VQGGLGRYQIKRKVHKAPLLISDVKPVEEMDKLDASCIACYNANEKFPYLSRHRGGIEEGR